MKILWFYAITADLIADGWWIEHCDIMGRGRPSGKLDPRIIAMRWHEGRVVDSPRWRHITDPNELAYCLGEVSKEEAKA